MITATLLVPHRERPEHLCALLAWVGSPHGLAHRADVEVVVLDADPTPGLASSLAETAGVRYLHTPQLGPFPKARVLNIGLAASHGELVIPHDVDLLPLGDTVHRHLAVARATDRVVITGHRVMSDRVSVPPDGIVTAALDAELAPEDREQPTYRSLLLGERFGIEPVLWRRHLESVGGWDEAYVGWGGEDQELLDRYTARTGALLVQSPDLLYLHLHHEHVADWNELTYVTANRRRYFESHAKPWI